ncbi:hypothetical protein [Methanobrevibacter sp.]|uniref:hypothetical protein n=1 Tax=Methanobrevibacter sp. TaxID=66852 RepID=UPI0038909E08
MYGLRISGFYKAGEVQLTKKEALNSMFVNGNGYMLINNGYGSYSRTIYDSFINAIKELKEKIYSNVENIIVQNNPPALDELIQNIKDSFDNTENILSNLDFFEDEFYDFSSIKDMAFYILDNKSLLHHISMIRGLLNSFYDLVQFKKGSSNEAYEQKYYEFSSELVDIEQSFYAEIYEPSENYNEETLSEISNSLLG